MLCFLLCSVFAQKNVDVVYLKDGAVKRGQILKESDQTQSSKVKIITRYGNVFIYAAEEIDSIRKEGQFRLRQLHQVQDTGYFGLIQVGAMLSNESGWIGRYPFIRTMHGHQFNENMALGLGVELSAPNNNAISPVYAYGRYTFNGSARSGYCSASAGYSISLERTSRYSSIERNGGLMFGTAIGRRIYIRKKLAFDYSVGYRFYKLMNRVKSGDDNFISGKYIYRLNRVSLNLGLYFN